MRVIILIQLIFTISNPFVFGQHAQYQCGTEYPLAMLLRLKEVQDSISEFGGARNFTSYPVSVFIHRRSDGTGGMSPSDFYTALEELNQLYAPANIGFFLCHDIEFVDSDALYDFSKLEENTLFNAHHVNNTINLYLPNSLTTPSGTPLCGYAYFPGWGNAAVVDRVCAMDGSSLAHEMGHIFGLYHTHGLNNNNLTDELVNTINCAVAADDLCDTPADPNLHGKVDEDCNYTGTTLDPNGEPYEPDIYNIMSYSAKPCRQQFTEGQYQRIGFVAYYLRNDLACIDLSADFTATPLLSLCENQVTVLFHYTGMGATSFAWDIDGDGETDYTESDPVHEYNSLGNYFVTLTVSNGIDTIQKTLPSLVQLLAQFSGPFSDIAEEEVVQRSVINPDGSYTWEIKDLGPSNPNGKAWLMDNYHYNSSGQSDHLLIGPFNLNEMSEPKLSFDVSYAPYNSIREDALSVQISVNCGENYQQIYYKSGLELGTAAGYQTLQWVPITLDEWRNEEISLAMFEDYDEVTIRFTNITDFGNNLYLDNISVSGELALGLDILSFQGINIDAGRNLLTWETAHEEGMAHFILEESINGIIFNYVDHVPAQNALHNVYRYEDLNPQPRSYYRLRAVEHDGSEIVSNIVFIGIEGMREFLVYPNPVRETVFIQLDGEETGGHIKMYDRQGTLVMTTDPKAVQRSSDPLGIDVSDFPAGLYTVVVGDNRATRFIKTDE